MLIIDLKGLGKEVESAVKYLRARLDEPLKLKGSQIQLTSINAHTAKSLLHKFLRKEEMEGYRVVVARSGLVQVLAPKRERKSQSPERFTLFPNNETIPYYQVAAEMGGIVPKPGRRKWRP